MIWTPYPYQVEMLDWIDSRPESMLWAGCGVGKTVVVLTSIANSILEGRSKGALVIAPFRVLATAYKSQVERWDHLNWITLANMRTPEGQAMWEDGSADVYLINSERLPSIERVVKGKTHRTPGFVEKFIKGRKEIPVDTLVIDEISTAKNPSSKRFNALRPFLQNVESADGKRRFVTPFKRKIGMTGTPHPNSYLDVFAPTRLIDGGKRFGTSFTRYRDQYFTSDYLGYTWTIKDGAKEKIDAKLADLAIIMRSEDYLDLPPCITEDVEVTLPPKAMTAYKTLEKEFLVELDTGEIEALSAAALTTKLLQITCGLVFDAEKDTHLVHDAKVKALRKLRKKHKGEPLLVFTSYISERERILKEFPDARQFDERHMEEWQAGKIPMWVSDARSIQFGIDGLQVSGRICVWMTPTYSWETYHQAISRLVRTGQEEDTIIYRILAKGTIDEAVVAAIQEKENGNAGLMAAIKALQELKKAG